MRMGTSSYNIIITNKQACKGKENMDTGMVRLVLDSIKAGLDVEGAT